jgi:hypothetical protein
VAIDRQNGERASISRRKDPRLLLRRTRPLPESVANELVEPRAYDSNRNILKARSGARCWQGRASTVSAIIAIAQVTWLELS